MTPRREIWFPAKRYGWGWGPPVAWQGWVFLIAWLVLLISGSAALMRWDTVAYVVFVATMIAVLLGVCYAKGEKPRWRWGDPDARKPR